MYSKSETVKINKEFWTTFGSYMKPVRNAEGQVINWINYKTGVKHVFFRMDADKKKAAVAIEITHPLAADRMSCYQKLLQLSRFFEDTMEEPWNWEPEALDETGATLSKVFTALPGVNIFERDDWPAIISFLKQRLIKLDEFWNLAKQHFESA